MIKTNINTNKTSAGAINYVPDYITLYYKQKHQNERAHHG